MTLKTADWYFDYISPFAYLQCALLEQKPLACDLRPRPILFAALLNHHGQKGPAEIAPKRFHTYRQVIWEARRLGIELNFPPAHPFNPLPLLRATLAAGSHWKFIRDAFHLVWGQGVSPSDEAQFGELLSRHEIDSTVLSDPKVKSQLRDNTEAAVARGVFGVPTIAIDDELYWGVDHTEMVAERLAGADWFDSDRIDRLKNLPEAASRR